MAAYQPFNNYNNIGSGNYNTILGLLQQFCYVLTITTLELFVLMLHSTLTAIVKKFYTKNILM